MTIEFRNDTGIDISVRFLVTKMKNLYVDVGDKFEAEDDKRYTLVKDRNYEVVELQPEWGQTNVLALLIVSTAQNKVILVATSVLIVAENFMTTNFFILF